MYNKIGWFGFFVLSIFLQQTTAKLPETVTIGALFDKSDEKLKAAFKYAIERANEDPWVLPHTKLIAYIETVSYQNTYETYEKVCDLINKGVVGIFSPQTEYSFPHVKSVCDLKNVPRFEMTWNNKELSPYGINLYPNPATIAQAYIDLIKEWKWKSFTIIYHEKEGMFQLKHLLNHKDIKQFSLRLRYLSDDSDFRPLLEEIKATGEQNIILDIPFEYVHEMLKEAEEAKMMSEYFHYMITAWDLDNIDLREFKNGAKINTFRLMDIYRDVQEKDAKTLPMFVYELTPTCLIYDGVNFLVKAIEKLNTTDHVKPQQLACDSKEIWSQGQELMSILKTMTMESTTGVIRYDFNGLRSDFKLDIVEVNSDGELTNVGWWNKNDSVQLFKSRVERSVHDKLSKDTLIISTIPNNPYIIVGENNKTFEGFAVDIIDEISKMYSFKYKIKLADDYRYGNLDPETKKWNGMMGDVVEGRADMAIADLTMTQERESAVDFSMPFMSFGIGVLYIKPEYTKPFDLLFFMQPFSTTVWICIGLAYLVASLVIFIIARFSIYEWENVNPNTDESKISKNKYSMKNSFWLTASTLMQQGSNIMPKAIATRMVATLWWFFTLIMICFYIANTVKLLSSERDETEMKLADIIYGNKIKYGCLQGGSTCNFFKTTDHPVYSQMWEIMEKNKDVFVKTNMEGIKRVKEMKGQYAYIMEGPSLDYALQRNCKLMKVAGEFNNRAYGIALPKNSEYTPFISLAILKLQETGKLEELKNKWWVQKGGDACQYDKSAMDFKQYYEIDMDDLSGLFVFFVLGLFLAFFVAMCEFTWTSHKAAKDNKEPVKAEIRRNLNQAIHGDKVIRKAQLTA